MLTIVWGLGWVVTSIERTAYPRFKRLITAHELHLFFSPTRDELQWASDATDCDEHLLALLLMLKSYQRMGCFPKLEDVPAMMVDFVRRHMELPEGTLPVYQAEKTAKNHRGLVRKRVGVLYDQAEARRIVEQSIRKEAAAKNRPADLRLLGGAAVRADRPGPGGDVRPRGEAGVHRHQRGRAGAGCARARPAAPGGPR
ncbi:DUF4158 domain-containing protein [Streptomyces platensis]|uniref:DUF4158 domain-containing protein n=1 Tax=Streptomyces platensis TaxID=58346 RepID=UPI0036C3228D